jgi:hypothetical protein
MASWKSHPFYGKKTINNEFDVNGVYPDGLDWKQFILSNPCDLHQQTNEFFQDILGKAPSRDNIYFESKEKTGYWRPGARQRDMRRIILAMDHSGFSIALRCKKGHGNGNFEHIYVCASRFYEPRQFGQMLYLPQSIGLPEPSMIQTRGDSIMRYLYILDYQEPASQGLKSTDLQLWIERLWAGAKVDSGEPEILIPGTSNYRHGKQSKAKVRTVGGSRKKIEARQLYISIEKILKKNEDDIVYAFVDWKPTSTYPIRKEEIETLAQQILKRYAFKSKLGRRHFFVAFTQAILESGYPLVDTEGLAGLMPFEVDYRSCPSTLSTTPEGVTSSYFWWLAEVTGCCDSGPKGLASRFGKNKDLPVNYSTKTPGDPCRKDRRDVNEIIKETEEDMGKLKAAAQTIAIDHKDLAIAEQLQLLRNIAKSLPTAFEAAFIQKVFATAQMYANGALDPLTPDDQLKFDAIPWLWDEIIIEKSSNLIVAQPKTGKTTLMLAFVAALLKGEKSFLNKNIRTFSGKVVIIGTDQPEGDWARMLQVVGLLDENQRMHPSLIKLHAAGRPLRLDERGFETLESYARENSDLLVLLDSYAACTAGLGIDENSTEAGGVVQQLVSKMATYGATLLIIHHSGKGMGADSPTAKSRGSSSIPAAVSQIVSLSRFTSGGKDKSSSDNRIVLSTEGRAGQPTKMLIQRTEAGWVRLGDTKHIQKELTINEKMSQLNPRQLKCYQYIRNQWECSENKVRSAELAAAFPDEFRGSDAERSARDTLSQLESKGLVRSDNGHPLLWCPSDTP